MDVTAIEEKPGGTGINSSISIHEVEQKRPAQAVAPVMEAAEVPDQVEVTSAARAPYDDSASLGQGQTRPASEEAVSVEERLGSAGSRSVRELVATFDSYNNSQAIASASQFIDLYSKYGGGIGESMDASANQDLAGMDPFLVLIRETLHPTSSARDIREAIREAINRWFLGAGVFSPVMLGHSSRAGFRFSPLSSRSMRALHHRDIIATSNRAIIAAYLREMVLLRPGDFMFYDPTGLGSLGLLARWGFLSLMANLLSAAGASAHASDLHYRFNRDGTPDFDYLDRQIASARRRLSDLINQRTDAYGQMLNQYQRYGLSVISSAFT